MMLKFPFVDRLLYCVSKTLTLTIEGDAKSKDRPKHNFETKVTYTPNKTHKIEKLVRDIAKVEMEKQNFPKACGDMPVIVEMTFYHTIPKSRPKWWKSAARNGLIPCVTRNRGDIDNKIKLYLDGMNDVVYKDDAQVCEVRAFTRYADEPRTEIKVRALYVDVSELKDMVRRIEEDNA